MSRLHGLLQYVAFRVLALLAPRIPPKIAYPLCDLFGDLLFLILPRRRSTVLRNLSVVKRGARTEEVRRLARLTFREGVKYYFDTFRAPSLSVAQLERMIEIEGIQNLDAALAGGSGAILITAHYGSPALVVQVVAARGYRITTVAEPVRPQKLFELINGVRGSRGVRLLALGPASFRDLTAVLERNEIAGVVADRDVQGTGVSVTLFGDETQLPGGPVLLALRTGAPLLPAFSLRRDDGSFAGHIGPALELERTGNLREDVRTNTQRIAEVLETFISRQPEQWIVFEPIWPE